MNDIVDFLWLVFLVKLPARVSLDPVFVWHSVKIFYWAVVLVGTVHLLARDRLGALGFLVFMLFAYGMILLHGHPDQGDLTGLLLLLLLFSPIAGAEGILFGSGLVTLADHRLLITLGLLIAIIVGVAVTYAFAEVIGILIYLGLMLSVATADLYRNADEEERSKGKFLSLVCIAFIVWTMLGVSAMDGSSLNDANRVLLATGRWSIGGFFLSGAIGGGWYRMRA